MVRSLQISMRETEEKTHASSSIDLDDTIFLSTTLFHERLRQCDSENVTNERRNYAIDEKGDDDILNTKITV